MNEQTFLGDVLSLTGRKVLTDKCLLSPVAKNILWTQTLSDIFSFLKACAKTINLATRYNIVVFIRWWS